MYSFRRRAGLDGNLRYGALLVTIGSRGANDARQWQIEFSSPVRLALDQL
jgi:hypothetical protein